ncbi:MAG: DinB family protein [Phycisphaerales bacterium]
MSARSETIANAITESLPLFERYLAGFGDANRTSQAPGLPNHAAWTLGHLALYARRAADLVEGHDGPQPLPDTDFVTGDGRAGDARRFDTESVCFGSTAVDDPAIYPAWDRCVGICRSGYERLAHAVSGSSDARLDRAVAWGSTGCTAERLAARMVFHLGTHTGQLIDLRRGLGMPALFG